MTLTSPVVLFLLLPAAVIAVHGAPARWRWLPLVLANVAAAALFDFGRLPLTLGLVVAAYLLGLWCAGKPRRSAVAAGVLLLPLVGWKVAEAVRPQAVPVGLSYLSFAVVAYVVDAGRGLPPERHAGRFLAGLLLFPVRLLGPIMRPIEACGQLRGVSAPSPPGFAGGEGWGEGGFMRRAADSHAHARSSPPSPLPSPPAKPGGEGVRVPVRLRRVLIGAERLIGGLGRATLVAQPLGLAADRLFAVPPDTLSLPAAWLGLLCYSLQLYHDFAGMTAVARGIGGLLGLRLPANFHHPYRATSLATFWRRWHATLSRWFRDYLYKPLAVRGCPPLLAGLIVFLVSGVWHGVGGTYLLWGVWHGVAWLLERRFLLRGRTWTLLVVAGGWVWFRAPTVPHAAGYFAALAGLGRGEVTATAHADNLTLLALAVGLILCQPLPRPRTATAFTALGVARVGVLLLSLWVLLAGGSAPGVYGRF